MDTGSHLLFGATLAGLAMLQPEVAQEPALLHAVLAAALIGSHAPDFDTVARVRGYAAYIRVHRGITHSLPALLLWPLVLSVPIAWGFGVWEHEPLVFAWTMAAVVFHVFLDWLNAYGVQCFRPFSQRWHHLDALPLFEPVLFVTHAAGLIAWLATGLNPGWMFLWIYFFTFVYIGGRLLHHQSVVRFVRMRLGLEGVCHVVPSLYWFRWQFVLESSDAFYTGNVYSKELTVKDIYAKHTEGGMAVEATRAVDGVRAFLHFAQRVHVTCTERQDGYEVRWRDMRFWHNHKLPFGVDVTLDQDLKVVSQSLGWRKKAWDPPYV
ncbi:metal-dependent hydrolase [Paenibacillus tyrfis]|uniref:metal-dependent hydrolase n=1 Tax=Paenibacillus tyrfis TaxID=1501230 RepID=UPI000B59628B|nr:metal-dependent hydrolase [Paenibacillus tyrfis]